MTPQYAAYRKQLETAPPERQAEWDAWFASRPATIQRAIQRFPPGSTYTHDDGELWYLLGWAEQKGTDDVSLIFSVTSPFDDYDAAHRAENRRYACMSHFDEPAVTP